MAGAVTDGSQISSRKRRSTAKSSRMGKSEKSRNSSVRIVDRDVSDIDDLRRSRIEYYGRTPNEKVQIATKSTTQVLGRPSSTKSTKPKVSTRSKSTKKTKSSRSSTGRSGANRGKDERNVSEYVYRDSFHSTSRRRPATGQEEDRPPGNIVSEEGLGSIVPPAAPDPPPLNSIEPPLTEDRIERLPNIRKAHIKRTAASSVSRRSSAASRPSSSARSKHRTSEPLMPAVLEVVPMTEAKQKERRRSSVIGSLLSPIFKTASPTPTYVECLTCASTKSSTRVAALECGHNMCHSCLKKLFTMSVTDPQHMPPRCCTSQHIPLKHVSKLFDNSFKSRWNAKYLEYTTRNRLYCPARGCGTWIAPQSTRKSILDPKRVLGTCPKCNTRACGSCGRKWHTNPDCDAGTKDESAREFAKMAVASGWQRCFNCTATVELKEGCNHMTCRCGAEFCMVCGTKWKGCDCPWFNYSAVAEADRFVNGAARIVQPAARGLHGYADELARRQEQERRDEELARRMQGIELHHWDDADRIGNGTPGMERDWGGNDTFGFGNMAGHFLNDHFVQRATAILTQRISPETREAANRLAAEIRADRTPPLPGNAFLDPVTQAFRPPQGQENGIVDAGVGNSDPLAASPRRRRPFHRRHATAEEILDDAGIPTVGRTRPRPRAPVLVEAEEVGGTDASGRSRSVLAGLATKPGEGRVEQWMDHVEDEEPR